MNHKIFTISLILIILAMPGSVVGAETDAEGTFEPTMPSLPDLLEIIDKATTNADQETPTEWAGPVKLVMVFTLLAVIPSLLAMTTSFTRIIIVLGFARKALATQTVPPNTTLMGLAIFLTMYSMAPTFYKINEQSIQPYLSEQLAFDVAAETASGIMKDFMIRQTHKEDLALFVKMSKIKIPKTPNELPFHVVVPSFIISEFRTAFEMGCLIFIPFLLLDLIVASILLSAGMMMLPPVMISMPLKLILFILIDGWGVMAHSLSLSFR
jgi:flagellar biosynthetic protein FliP